MRRLIVCTRDSDQAISTAKTVLAWSEQLDQPHG
jgi:hypothetical protein